MKTEIKLTLKKICNCCGRIQNAVPTNARPMMDITNIKIEGYFWECVCGSTMFVKLAVKAA